MEENYILALDVGTTTIRAFIYNTRTETVGSASDKVVLHYPQPGFVEIDPDELWGSVVKVVDKSLKNAHLSAGQMTAMGISTQRSSFITWSKETGKPFHRLITWKDMRADNLVRQWNNSFLWKMIRAGAYALYLVSGNEHFQAGSVLKFTNAQSTPRLYWAQQNVTALKKAIADNDAMFGTLDTWLLYKLTEGKIHMTDVSSASATGLYDPFTMEWGKWAMSVIGIRLNDAFLPKVVDTAGTHFTSTSPNIWGHPIPIISCMADQTASMWGSCCFEEGDVKLTMGTGSFFNINTGSTPHASASGLYSVVGWRIGKELKYSTEGASNDTASIITWAMSFSLFEDPKDSAGIALSVPDSDGVFFIPSFSGLGPPHNDSSAATGFIGIKPSTTKAHLVRAILESLAFRAAKLYSCLKEESGFSFNSIRVDGGVSNNDFVMQLIANLTGLRVIRPFDVEMTSLGTAYLVGLHMGIWKSKEELKSLRRQKYDVFHPNAEVNKAYKDIMAQWEKAVKRLCVWYTDKNPLYKTPTGPKSNSDTTQSINKSSSFKNGSFSKVK